MLRGRQPELFGAAHSTESVLALQPDLLTAVQSALTQRQYRRLGSAQPVVAQPPDTIDYGVGWRRQAEITDRAPGRSAEARELVDATQARIDRAREQHPALEGRTHVTIRIGAKGNYSACTEQDARTRLLEQLGLKLAPPSRTWTPTRAST